MKHVISLILTLFLVANLFLANSFAQDYVHYKTLTRHKGWVKSVSFSSDGKTIASGSGDHTIRLWDVGTGKNLHILTRHKNSVVSVSFSPDGQTLGSGSFDKTIRLWRVSPPQSPKPSAD